MDEDTKAQEDEQLAQSNKTCPYDFKAQILNLLCYGRALEGWVGDSTVI